MENKKLVYVGSPYSHESKAVMEENFKRVTAFTAKLCAEGVLAFSPITYGHTLVEFRDMPRDWNFWKTFCLSFMDNAERMIVYKMPGWENSRGLEAEIEYAKQNNIPIEYVDFVDDVPTESSKYELVLTCETAEELAAAIHKISSGGMIKGRSREFNAEKMASFVRGVIAGTLPANILTRNYGIRQQALYIQRCEAAER